MFTFFIYSYLNWKFDPTPLNIRLNHQSMGHRLKITMKVFQRSVIMKRVAHSDQNQCCMPLETDSNSLKPENEFTQH
jgi:hypothetical protein